MVAQVENKVKEPTPLEIIERAGRSYVGADP
jgi:hypothetical protein